MVCIKPVVHIMDKQVVRVPRRRREHSAAFKRELVARSLEPGVSVAAIAMHSGINANLLFGWRRGHLEALAQADPAAPRSPASVLLPVSNIISPWPSNQSTLRISPRRSRKTKTWPQNGFSASGRLHQCRQAIDRDIARIADIPIGTVMSRLAWGRRLMRDALSAETKPRSRSEPQQVSL
jgi:transposase